MDDFIAVLELLDLDFSVHPDRERRSVHSIHIDSWLKEAKPKHPRIWVPDTSARYVDYEVIVPYAIQRAISEIVQGRNELHKLKVAALYTVSLSVLTRQYGHSLEDRVFEDIVAAVKLGILTPDQRLLSDDDLSKSVSGELWHYSSPALMYTGFDPCDGTCKGLSPDEDVRYHPINLFSAYVASIVQPGAEASIPPRILQNKVLTLSQVRCFERNVVSLTGAQVSYHGFKAWHAIDRQSSTPHFNQKVVDCLRMRLKNVDEDRIRERLGFDKMADYVLWTEKESIDWPPSDSADAYAEWLEAKEFLGVTDGKMKAEPRCTEPVPPTHSAALYELPVDQDDAVFKFKQQGIDLKNLLYAYLMVEPIQDTKGDKLVQSVFGLLEENRSNKTVILKGDLFFRRHLASLLTANGISVFQEDETVPSKYAAEKITAPEYKERLDDLPLIISTMINQHLDERGNRLGEPKYICGRTIDFLLRYRSWAGFDHLFNFLREAIRADWYKSENTIYYDRVLDLSYESFGEYTPLSDKKYKEYHDEQKRQLIPEDSESVKARTELELGYKRFPGENEDADFEIQFAHRYLHSYPEFPGYPIANRFPISAMRQVMDNVYMLRRGPGGSVLLSHEAEPVVSKVIVIRRDQCFEHIEPIVCDLGSSDAEAALRDANIPTFWHGWDRQAEIDALLNDGLCSSSAEYDDLMRRCCCALSFPEPDTIYDEWKSACEVLGIGDEAPKEAPGQGKSSTEFESEASTKSEARDEAIYRFEKAGDKWVVSFEDGKTFALDDMLGCKYVHYLLGHPDPEGQGIHVLSLVGLVDPPVLAEASRLLSQLNEHNLESMGLRRVHFESPYDLVDKKTISLLLSRRDELDLKLGLDTLVNPEEKMEAKEELQAVKVYLNASTDIFGRSRKDTNVLNSKRTAVRRAIDRVIKHLVEYDSEGSNALAMHLMTSIKTGKYVSYTPQSEYEWWL
ncbi:MAG: hypothetical protein KOO62_12980 [candidate division Zixibacteria bacterium]|nr:hypothetical protein [candidate division Zixibacteria bacterium]